MGLLMNLNKDSNKACNDFIDAYWTIEDIGYGSNNGEMYCHFRFNAYASRDAKLIDNQSIPLTQYTWGGAGAPVYDTKLYTWKSVIKASEVFLDGVPNLEKDQKDALYAFLKSYLQLSEYTDVFEEVEEVTDEESNEETNL